MCPCLVLAVPFLALFGVLGTAFAIAVSQLLEALLAMLAVLVGVVTVLCVLLVLLITVNVVIMVNRWLKDRKEKQARDEHDFIVRQEVIREQQQRLNNLYLDDVNIPEEKYRPKSNPSEIVRPISHQRKRDRVNNNQDLRSQMLLYAPEEAASLVENDSPEEKLSTAPHQNCNMVIMAEPIDLSDLEVLLPPSEGVSAPPPTNPNYHSTAPELPLEAPPHTPLFDSRDERLNCDRKEAWKFYVFWFLSPCALGALLSAFSMDLEISTPAPKMSPHAKEPDVRSSRSMKQSWSDNDAVLLVEEDEPDWLDELFVLPFALLEYLDTMFRETYMEDYDQILLGVQSLLPLETDSEG